MILGISESIKRTINATKTIIQVKQESSRLSYQSSISDSDGYRAALREHQKSELLTTSHLGEQMYTRMSQKGDWTPRQVLATYDSDSGNYK